jgi:hypothetical protein
MSFKATVAAPPQMKPNRPQPPGQERDAPAQQQRPRSRKPGQLPLVAKIAISLLVAWHVTVVFLAPLSIQPSSPLVVEISQGSFIQKYLDALYLNHGYHFFAPEPSNGHLIQYAVMDDRGGILAQGEFPSKQGNWPRLLYHRYFMLADQCEVASPTDAEAIQWRDEYLKAYACQLLRENPSAAAVRVKRVVHFPLRAIDAIRINDDPSLQQYREEPLTYPPTYQDEVEVTQRRSDLDQGQAAATTSWRQDVASGWQGGVR